MIIRSGLNDRHNLRTRSGNDRWAPLAAMFILTLTLTVALSETAHAGGAAAVTEFVLGRHIALDAATRWDYAALDPASGRVFVTLGDHVAVVDPASGALVGRIGGMDGAHGVAFAPALGLGFISSGKTSTIVTFDLKSLAVLRTTPVGGENPDALLYLDGPGRLYSFNGKSHDVSVIDPATGAVSARIPVAGRPEFAAADAHTIYLNLEDTHQLTLIDIASAKVVRTFDLPGCDEPTGLALDAVHGRVFSVCKNGQLMVSAAAEGRVVTQVGIGRGPDAVVFDAARGLLISANGDSGTLSIVHQDDADHYRLVQTLSTAAKARTLAYQPATATVYLPVPGTPIFELLVAQPR